MQGKIKKADRAVKTSEAWWSFLEQLWEARAIVIPLLTGAGIVTSALWNTIDQISKFGWAGWVLASIPAIVMVGLVAWFFNWIYHSFQIRKIRRFREATGQSTLNSDAPTIDLVGQPVIGMGQYRDEIQSLIDSKLDQFVDTKISAKFETHAQAHGRDAKLADLLDRTSAVEQKLDLVGTYAEQTRRAINERIDWIGQAFSAVGHWDWHKGFYSKLVTDGDELCRLVDSPITDEVWSEWNNLEKHWRAELGRWLIFAEYYAPNTTEAVNEIKDHIYYSESWSFDEAIFSKADRVRRYKELAIAVMNLKNVKGHVERGMKHAAFEGVGKRGRQDYPPRLDVDR
jgi:hypothetical protein